MPMAELLNVSINATLSRSIITHVTVTLALLALLLFGGQAIHSFTATMMFGVVLVGTYTSIFIAAPILIYLGVGTGREAAEADARLIVAAKADRHERGRICRAARRSTPTARAAFASPTCRIAARCCACRPASRPGRWREPAEIDETALAPVFAEAGDIGLFLLGAGRDRSDHAGRAARPLPRAQHQRRARCRPAPRLRTYNVLLAEDRRVAAALIAVD